MSFQVHVRCIAAIIDVHGKKGGLTVEIKNVKSLENCVEIRTQIQDPLAK